MDREQGRRKAEFLSLDNAGSYGYVWLDSHPWSPRRAESEEQRARAGPVPDPDPELPVDAMVRCEFGRVAQSGVCYLDHAGATLHADSQMGRVMRLLTTTVAGNPHSMGQLGLHASDVVEQARLRVLRMFRARPADYEVVFTSGATAALKLVGECFPWSAAGSAFCFTADNHTSVLGVREYATASGADWEATVDPMAVVLSSGDAAPRGDGASAHRLFALPAESNFSGARYDLGLVRRLQEAGWLVLLDAAKYAATQRVDLSEHPADFVVTSFYKIVGYPSGLGALVVRRQAGELLRLGKRYFGGGTVDAVLAQQQYHIPRRRLASALEDGTVPFLSIAALQAGLDAVDGDVLTLEDIARHTSCLTQFLVLSMRALVHANGAPVCEVYGHHQRSVGAVGDGRHATRFPDGLLSQITSYGPVVAFNLLHDDGSYVGYAEVERLASACRIQLRTGCFCNSGACHLFLGLSAEDAMQQVNAGHVCWDGKDLVDGRPTGAVRLSLGYMSTWEDVDAWLQFVRTYFVRNGNEAAPSTGVREAAAASSKPLSGSAAVYTLSHLQLFPVKSCHSMSVDAWPIGPRGLLFDREWAVVSPTGWALSQKRVPAMCFVRPVVDCEAGTLTLSLAPDCPTGLDPLVLPIGSGDPPLESPSSAEPPAETENREWVKVCGTKCAVEMHGTRVEEWLTNALGQPCNLAAISPQHFDRRAPGRPSTMRRRTGPKQFQDDDAAADVDTPISLANEGQFLLVNRASARIATADVAAEVDDLDDLIARFRPNFVVSGAPAYAEDTWSRIRIGRSLFRVVGPCVRCSMVNINQQNATNNSRLFAALAAQKERRKHGKVVFGILLTHVSSGSSEVEEVVAKGDEVVVVEETRPF